MARITIAEDTNHVPRLLKTKTDGTLLSETVVTFGAGTPILELDSYSGADAAYQEVVSWTVSAGKTGVLHEVAFTRDASGKAVYKVTIGATVITDFTPNAHVNMPFSPNELAAGIIVKVEVKSSDGTTISIDASIIGDEQ